MHYSPNYFVNYPIASEYSGDTQYNMPQATDYDMENDVEQWNCAEFPEGSSGISIYQDVKERKNRISGTQRKAANERERRRMNSINQGFEDLRNRLPSSPCERKLSKVDTLRTAMQYIQQLKTILEQENKQDNTKARSSIYEQQKIVIEGNGLENAPSIYMVSWRRVPEKFGGIHQTLEGPIVYQNSVWHPPTEKEYPLHEKQSVEEDLMDN